MATIKGIKVGGPVTITASYGGKSATASLTVTALNLSGATISGLSNKVYTGSAIKTNPTVTISVGGTSTTLVKDTDYTVSWSSSSDSTSCIKVGTVTVTVTAKSGSNFTGSKTATYQITPATISKASANNQTYNYNGTAQGVAPTFTTVGSQSYTVTYGTVEGTYNSSTVPQRTNEGSQTVYYKVTAANHNDLTGSYTLKINAIAPTLTFTPVSGNLTYNGSQQNIGTVNYNGDGTAEYVVSTSTTAPSSGWASVTNGTTIKSSAAGAGTYYVYLKSSAGTNYTAITAKNAGSKEISKASGSFTWTATSGTITYNGSAQTIGTLKYTGNGTPEYAVSTSTSTPTSGWTEMSANTNVSISSSAATATTYYVHVKATEGANYNAVTAVNKGNKAISKKSATFTWTAVSGTLTYNGSTQKIGTLKYTGDGTPKYAVTTSSSVPADNSTLWTDMASGSNVNINSSAADADTYYVHVKATAGTNYKAVSAVNKGNKAIGKATPTLTFTPKTGTLTYNGSTQNIGTINYTGDGTAKYVVSTSSTKPADSAINTTVTDGTTINSSSANAGTYYVYLIATAGTNYNAVASKQGGSKEIVNATITVKTSGQNSVINQSYTYTGSAQGTGLTATTVASQTATIKYGSAEGSYTSTDVPTRTASGSQTVFYQVTANNHNTVTGSYTLEINDATFTVSEPDQTYTYNGNPQGAAISVSNIKGSQTATIRYRTATSGDYTLTSAPTLTNAGSQTVYWQVTVPNHVTQSGSYTLTIDKATPTMSLLGNIVTPETDQTSPSGIPYHGVAYIEGRASVVGKIYWGTSTSSMPTSVNVTTPSTTTYNVSITTRESLGTTTVYAYFVPTDTTNYNTLGNSSTYHASAAAKIIQSSDNGISVETSNNLAYTGSPQVIATVSSDEGILVTNGVKQYTLGYSTTNGGTVTWGTTGSSTLSVTGPGTYYVHYKFSPDANHSHEESNVQIDTPVTIGNGTLTVTSTGYSGTYDGSQHNIITSISAVNQNGASVSPTYTYSTDGTNFVSTMPKVTNVSQSGTYHWKATLSGYTTETGTVTVTISKADNPMTISSPTGTSSSSRYKIYNTQGYNTVQITTSGAVGSVTYVSSATGYATVDSSGLVTYQAAGNANITVTAAGDSNYKSGSKTVYVQSVVDTIKTYGNVTGTITITQTDDFPAGGVTLTTANIEDYFEYSSTCSQTLTWNSGNTTQGTITYAWSGSNAVISSLGTNAKARTSLSIGSFTVTATGQGTNKTNSQSVTSGYQEANAVVSINLTLGSNSIVFGNSTTATVTGTYTSGSSGVITPTSLTAEDDTIVEITS